VALPGLIITGLNAYVLWNKHWEHWSHLPPLEERTEYPYQNIRTKNFFWGDGDKVSLFLTFQ
jgi:cytochrome c oxidase subunit 6a